MPDGGLLRRPPNGSRSGGTGCALSLVELVHERAPRLLSDDAIDFDGRARLELPHGVLGIGAISAIYLPWIEAQRFECALHSIQRLQIQITKLVGVVLEMRHFLSSARGFGGDGGFERFNRSLQRGNIAVDFGLGGLPSAAGRALELAHVGLHG